MIWLYTPSPELLTNDMNSHSEFTNETVQSFLCSLYLLKDFPVNLLKSQQLMLTCTSFFNMMH